MNKSFISLGLTIIFLTALIGIPLKMSSGESNAIFDEYPLPGDVDHNRRVNLLDLEIVNQHWLEEGCDEPNWCLYTDIDTSHTVDMGDYSLLAPNWLVTDFIRLDKTSLAPLETVNITVLNVYTSCTIEVTTPGGVVHSFGGTIADGKCTAGYTPSYLLGTYQVQAMADGEMTETEIFTVSSSGSDIWIQNWQADQNSYYPQRDITFTFDLEDPNHNPLSGFSPDLSDTRYDSDSGRLSILRRIQGVAEDGTITARVMIYFDTTGRWSDIYAGTNVILSLYYKDGSPLPGDFTLSAGTENNGGGHLSNALSEVNGIDRLDTSVNTNFSGSDKISYVDIVIPPTRNLSDVLFSVDYIKYNYNTGWQDRIYITEKYVDVPSSGYTLTTGNTFSTLGRLPIYLPLTPNENGLIYYSIHSDDPIGETHLKNGSISETSGAYANIWRWNDFVNTQARFYVYADKWGHAHDFTDAISMGIDPDFNQTGLTIENWNADSTTYFPEEAIEFSFDLKDTADAAITGFTGTIKDSVPNSDGGALYLLREIRDVAEDGSAVARLSWYFDTTGGWSDIYTGTVATISLYNKDGLTPLTGAVTLSTGFENNDDNVLSATLNGNLWQVQVDTSFGGADKIAYLDFTIPAGMAVSDVVVSVDNIKYNRNSGWGDRFVIAGVSVSESSFPRTLDGALEFQTGDRYPGLGRFPLLLPLNPNPNGFIFYKLDSADIAENNINYGSLSEAGGSYANSFTWNDYLVTTAKVYPYVDKWWHHSAAVGPAIDLTFDDTPREIAIFDYSIDSLGYTYSDTRQMSASVADGLGSPVNGLKLRDAVSNSDSGKISIVTQNIRTIPDPNHVVRLLVYFDTTGSWSDIYAGTDIQISIYGPDGKTAVPPEISIQQGQDPNTTGNYITTTLTETAGVYQWQIHVDQNFGGLDLQVYLDFICPDDVSASNVIYAVDAIKYFFNDGWADSVTIRNQTISQDSFPRNLLGQVEFTTGYKFGNLGRFPLYLSLNPSGGAIFPRLKTDMDVDLTGSMTESNGDYTYSHHFIGPEVGSDFETALCIGKFGYNNNEYRCTETIDLLFTGQPRYLGGLNDEPILLGNTWQKNLEDHFFVETDPANVEYVASDPNIIIVGNQASFTPMTTDDTLHDVVITARSTINPATTVDSDPFTIFAATCLGLDPGNFECADADPNTINFCNLNTYQCEAVGKPDSQYYRYPQGVDLQVLNHNVTISNPFPNPGDSVQICADVVNTGTTYIWDVQVNFYLDDANSIPIGTETIEFLPITYMHLSFRPETVCIDWQVPADLEGTHRIWVEVFGDYPLGMEEDMISNNYATRDFFVNNLNQADSSVSTDTGPVHDSMSDDTCVTYNMLIPVKVRVCEDELVCGPVMGYELSYWDTLYWPSWSGYCQEFGVPQEFITDFIRTYETLVGLGSQGAGSSLPSLTDIPGILQPEGWSDGWLPCHPEPTLFWYILYAGVIDPGCGGMCPVSAWDCGQGVSFQPRFDSQYYNAYEFKTFGGPRKVTRCDEEIDYIEIPYQVCYPDDVPFNVPINLFGGGPGGGNGGYGGGGLGTGPGGSPPIMLSVGPPLDPNGSPLEISFTCTFNSSGTAISYSSSDIIHCEPGVAASSAAEFLAAFNEDRSPIALPSLDINSGVDLGQYAPDFRLPDVNGDLVSLSDYYGQNVLLVFGNTLCPHCRARIPLLNALNAQLTYKVILVALGATESAAAQYVAENNIQFQVLVDTNRRMGRTFGIRKVPEVFIVDPDGVIKYSGPRQGQVIWYQLADSVVADASDNQQKLPDLKTWSECGLFKTYPDPYAALEDFNQDQKVDLNDLKLLSLNWLLEDIHPSQDVNCNLE